MLTEINMASSKECKLRIEKLNQIIPVKIYQNRLLEIDELMTKKDFWNDQKSAALINKERQKIISIFDTLNQLSEEMNFLNEYELTFPNDTVLFKQLEDLSSKIDNFEIKHILNNTQDYGPAILMINSGAGGLEAKNWAQILTRQYMRYADSMGWKINILNEKPSEEHSNICLDSITLQITGAYAYGYLKNETGVHRLIRNSPFNSGQARHTSFASISVLPDIEDTIDIVINEKDLDIQATRSGGSGGQAVNKISSCIILKHIPSGITIRSQTESSQHENKRIALKILKAKLFDIEQKNRDKEKEKLLATQANVSFGNQIRTITLQPYALVKDHRTNFETNQTDSFLDGNIHACVLETLRHQANI